MYSEALHSLTLKNRWNTCSSATWERTKLEEGEFLYIWGVTVTTRNRTSKFKSYIYKTLVELISAFLTKISLFNTILVTQVCPFILGHISVPINFKANFRLYCRGQSVCIFASRFQFVEFIWIHLTFIPFLSFIGKQKNFIHFF